MAGGVRGGLARAVLPAVPNASDDHRVVGDAIADHVRGFAEAHEEFAKVWPRLNADQWMLAKKAEPVSQPIEHAQRRARAVALKISFVA